MMNIPARYGFPLFAAALAIAIVPACSAFGPRFRARDVSCLKPGITTIVDLREQFGEPKGEFEDASGGAVQRYLTYGPDAADYWFRIDVADRLIGFERIMHTGCLVSLPGKGNHRPLNARIPIVDPFAPLAFKVNVTTQTRVAEALGACREGMGLEGGGIRLVFGPRFDQWILDFDAQGVLSRPPQHELRPELWNAGGV